MELNKLALQSVFGKLKTARICKGIQHMSKDNIKIINKLCTKSNRLKNR